MKEYLSVDYEQPSYFDKVRLDAIFSQMKNEVIDTCSKRLLGEKSNEFMTLYFNERDQLSFIQDANAPIEYITEWVYERGNNNTNTDGKLRDFVRSLSEHEKEVLIKIVYAIERIQTITITYDEISTGEDIPHGNYKYGSNSITIFLKTFESEDYAQVKQTMFHEIEHAIESVFIYDNIVFTSQLGLQYTQNIYALIEQYYYKETKLELDTIMTDLFISALEDLYETTHQGSHAVLQIPEEEIVEIIDESLDVLNLQAIGPEGYRHLLETIKMQIPQELGEVLLSKIPNIDINSEVFENTVFHLLLPRVIDTLFDHIQPKRMDLEREKNEFLKKKFEYLTDKKVFLEEYRARILTTKYFLESTYFYYQPPGSDKQVLGRKVDAQFHYKDESTGDIKILSFDEVDQKNSLDLSHAQQWRSFIDQYDGLNLIEKDFNLQNRIIIEAFFMKDQAGNDLIDQLITIRNGMVIHQEDQQKYSSYS